MKKGGTWFKKCLAASLLWLLVFNVSGHVTALTNPGSGSVGLEGKISTDAPKQGATITVPPNGAVFTKTPITVSGLCPKNLLVKIFSNNVFVGATTCPGGSYSLQVDLFSGQNNLVARVYDALDQAGPDSNTVIVTFNSAQFIEFGTQLLLTSNYGSLGANPGEELNWPIVLSGGSGPYAISIDWGDTSTSLQSQTFAGTFTIKHTYKSAGVYRVIVRATDARGATAYLQLVAIANGQIASTGTTSKGNNTQTTRLLVLWWPILLAIPLISAAFWLGRRHELYTLRKHLEKSRG